ncbi:hypothetical protein GOP47_0024538 [Adiantum capillus-veneris]|uniref:Uncharacterized protein n=1 Tax=Adiantum capillus-veneris TaxID=13818 RepID=A0A9D4U2A9_ADICA|nr:hypothetical protein GOP47_0024538 [Adiantum capillus-veneris]
MGDDCRIYLVRAGLEVMEFEVEQHGTRCTVVHCNASYRDNYVVSCYFSTFKVSDNSIWSRNAFRNLVDLLGSSSAAHQQQKQAKEKTLGKEKTMLRGLPGFHGSERPAVADIHILCHVFKHIPWSPSVELHLRRRNFGLTTHQFWQTSTAGVAYPRQA